MPLVDFPFGPDPVPEIHLADAPLVKVVAQVRFPLIASVGEESFIAPFQEALRAEYPILRRGQEVTLQVGLPEGQSGVSSGGTVWRFSTKPGDWQVSLGPTFLAIDTSTYTTRDEFLGRLRTALETLARTISPATYDRFGVRYVDRIQGEALADISELIRPEMLGFAGMSLGVPSVEVGHSVSDTAFRLDQAVLRARWGLLPPGATVDPFTEGAAETAWVLDLDAYTDKPGDFDVSYIADLGASYARMTYRFFRWCVTDKFLLRYGGDLR